MKGTRLPSIITGVCPGVFLVTSSNITQFPLLSLMKPIHFMFSPQIVEHSNWLLEDTSLSTDDEVVST